MTLFCAHRRNTLDELDATPAHLGIEMDVRTFGERLVVHHEPAVDAVDFETWLDAYRHRFLIVNTKEEGLEEHIMALLAERGIVEWAFLDQSFPFLVKLLRTGETRTMVRVSEYESPATALALPTRPDWVWLDSFTGAIAAPHDLSALAAVGYRFMVVSPELQGRPADHEIAQIVSRFAEADVPLHGVCTKRPDLWEPHVFR